MKLCHRICIAFFLYHVACSPAGMESRFDVDSESSELNEEILAEVSSDSGKYVSVDLGREWSQGQYGFEVSESVEDASSVEFSLIADIELLGFSEEESPAFEILVDWPHECEKNKITIETARFKSNNYKNFQSEFSVILEPSKCKLVIPLSGRKLRVKINRSLQDSGNGFVLKDITPESFLEDRSQKIILPYEHEEGLLANSCAVLDLESVYITQECICVSDGGCFVYVQGEKDFFGTASFKFLVSSDEKKSKSATANLTIDPTPDEPMSQNFSATILEDVQTSLQLSYSDADGDKGTSCAVKNLSNISIAQACSCNQSGICTVTVLGNSEYNGQGGFDFTVDVGGQQTELGTALLSISPVDDAPIVVDFSPSDLVEGSESSISIAYTDQESDEAQSCNLSSLTNISVTTACECSAGVCSVGVTGTPSYIGAGSFQFTVTSNSLTSNVANATLNIIANPDIPYLTTNSGLETGMDTRRILSSETLVGTHTNDNDSELVFTIKSAPSRGGLKKQGTSLGLDDTFTVQDVKMGLIYYEHTAGDTLDDSFQFTLNDSDSDYAAGATTSGLGDGPATFTISITDYCSGQTGPFTTWDQLDDGDSYSICSRDQLDDFAANCNTSTKVSCDQNITLRTNVDYSGATFNMISGLNVDDGFLGVLDGGGHTISGITLDLNIQTAGFIRVNRGTVKDLNLTEVNMENDLAYTGIVTGENEGSIIRVYTAGIGSNNAIEGPTTSSQFIGGIAGINRGTITESWSAANVSSSANWIGGITGQHSFGATISRSIATGSATGRSSVGGAAGVSQGTITDSYAEGDVFNNAFGNVGGFVGSASGGTISNSYATGDVTGASGNIGGFAGYITAQVSDCYATGDVSGGTVTGIGGFAGTLDSSGDIFDCSASGSVTATGGSRAGGAIGQTEGGSTVYRCKSTGPSVSGDERVGGFVGFHSGSSINESYSTSTVSGFSSVGGFTGYGDSLSRVNNSYATGDVSVSSTDAGGFVGFCLSCDTYNVYTISDVTGAGANQGGFMGWQAGSGFDLELSFWNTTTSSNTGWFSGSTQDSAEVKGESTATLQTQATFVGWDFDSIWNSPSPGNYPTLQNTP